jgi:hypothetical protein
MSTTNQDRNGLERTDIRDIRGGDGSARADDANAVTREAGDPNVPCFLKKKNSKQYSNTWNCCVSNLHHVTLAGNSLRTHTGIRNAGRHIHRVHRTQRVTGPPRPNLLKGNGFSTTTATNTTTATMLPSHVRKYCPMTATPPTATIMHAKNSL